MRPALLTGGRNDRGRLSKNKYSFNVDLIKDKIKFCVLKMYQMLVLIFYRPSASPQLVSSARAVWLSRESDLSGSMCSPSWY